MTMYVGRIVAIARNEDGNPCALYRVSSRSFPNREAKQLERAIAIVPKPGSESDIFKNPYIAYNCLRLVGPFAVATNGSHTDYIAEKLEAGYGPRDALTTVLHGMDYEHDQLNTPRIAAIVSQATPALGFLGIVTKDSVLVTGLDLAPGQARYVATYEHIVPGQYSDEGFAAATADDACQYILSQGVFADLERPVSAACAVSDGARFQTAIADVS